MPLPDFGWGRVQLNEASEVFSGVDASAYLVEDLSE
jgi:imidazoleglycerol phosphate synthase glutamine amidotransferase subunit HisH